jgi:hypothetical protein
LQQGFTECRRDAHRFGIAPRLQEYLALAAKVARRLAGGALDLGNLAADALPLRNQLQ